MESDILTYLIALPVCFLVGIMNASAGGGGLISLPMFLLLGLPPHTAIGTNKLQAVMGLAIANIRYAKSGLIHAGLAACTGTCGIIASLIGANLSLMADETVLVWLMVIALPVSAFFVFRKNGFDNILSDDITFSPGLAVKMSVIALVIGFYDGFYGPGAGTFYIIAICAICQVSVRRSTAQAKFINFSVNLTAMIVFLVNGQIDVPLALACGACNIAGSWIGANLVIKNGSKIMKPLIAIAFVLIIAKIVLGF